MVEYDEEYLCNIEVVVEEGSRVARLLKSRGIAD